MTHVERDQIIREFIGDVIRELDHDAMIEMALIKLIQTGEETVDIMPPAEVHPGLPDEEGGSGEGEDHEADAEPHAKSKKKRKK